MNESAFTRRVLSRIEDMFPGCQIIRGDASIQQGIPDYFILWGPCWASLEFKKSPKAGRQPNQEYFVRLLNEMSFAAFIDPESEEEVLHALEQAFENSSRRSCVSQS